MTFPLPTLMNGERTHQKGETDIFLKTILIKEVLPFALQPTRLVGFKQNRVSILNLSLPTKQQESASPTTTTVLALRNLVPNAPFLTPSTVGMWDQLILYCERPCCALEDVQ